MNKQTARIDQWTEIPNDWGGYLVGTVSEHPRQAEFRSTVVRTSPIVRLDRENGICETRNTVYTLGEEHVVI